jgi:hypothetical protein
VSMPVATYKFTACDFSSWVSNTWGYRFYLYGEIEVPMRVTMCWCKACPGLVEIEVLPTATGEAKLQQLPGALQVELHEELTASPPKKRWWQRHARKSTQQSNLEYEIESAE